MVQLSSSKLSIFKNCPRCFWLAMKKKVERPRGGFPSLPNGMDRKIKAYFDNYRMKRGLPLEISHPQLQNFDLFHDLATLKCWRQWNSKGALKVVTKKWTLVGGFDDVLYCLDENTYAPFDYKTTGSEDKAVEEVEKFYQSQMDLYALMLEENNFKSAGFAGLLIYCPNQHLTSDVQSEGIVKFSTKVFILPTDIYRAKALCDAAAECLESEVMPTTGEDCEFCKYTAALSSLMLLGATA